VGWISRKHLASGRGRTFFLTSLLIELIDPDFGEQTAHALAHYTSMDLRNPLPPLFPLTTIAGGSNLPRMKLPILTILLLAPALVFGQKFQDVTAKWAPLSLSVKADYPDMGPYVAAHNNSSKGVLAIVTVCRTTDGLGRIVPGLSTMDYAFKFGVIRSQEDRGVMTLEAADPGSSIKQADGAVLFVQFEDGSTWGDAQAGKDMLAERPQKLAFLKHIVETYYESGESAFTTALNNPSPGSAEFKVAACLKGDAEDGKVSTIDLAKKRLAAAQQWQSSGILFMPGPVH